MKKLLTLTFFAAVVLEACEKEGNRTVELEQTMNHITAVPDNSKTGNTTFLLSLEIGHSSKECPEGCVMVDGHRVHVNCMGFGNECVSSAIVQLSQFGNFISATTIDTFSLTSENFFLMPARSLTTKNEKEQPVWLNIPAQLVYRDSATLQFTFNGLYYSDRAAYRND